MLDCQHASQLISKSLDRQLSWRERFAVRLHLFICQYCTRFSQQLMTTRKALKHMSQAIENDPEIRLPAESKNRIAQSIESATE